MTKHRYCSSQSIFEDALEENKIIKALLFPFSDSISAILSSSFPKQRPVMEPFSF